MQEVVEAAVLVRVAAVPLVAGRIRSLARIVETVKRVHHCSNAKKNAFLPMSSLALVRQLVP